MTQHNKNWTDRLEETLIALILGAMTVVTFANVVARYGFNSNILWAVEFTVFLFGWMVLLGASYAVKIGAHLGVDAVLNIVSPQLRKVFGLIAVTVCILFSFLLLKGAWDYWANFANMLRPMPALVNPMPEHMRQSYEAVPAPLRAVCDELLFERRDFIFAEHLALPLDF